MNDKPNYSVTSAEQSKRLIELGYSAETADLIYIKPPYFKGYHLLKKEWAKNYDDSYAKLPAWSLARLIDLLPEYLDIALDEMAEDSVFYDLRFDKYSVTYATAENKIIFTSGDKHTLLEAIVDTFVWLAENGWKFKVDENENMYLKT